MSEPSVFFLGFAIEAMFISSFLFGLFDGLFDGLFRWDTQR